jgi:DNA-binding transcriptional LysR family regulator
MNIESLMYFKKVAEAKSISKASIESHLSQPALSQTIQKLEEIIGYELFSRSNKGVELTDIGRVFYEYAINMLKLYQKMNDDLANMAVKRVIINCTWAIANYALPCLLVEMKKSHPRLEYELQSNRSEDIIKNIENALVDIGIIYGCPDSDKINSDYFCDEEIVLVASKELGMPIIISIDDLFKCKIINFKNGCYNTDIKRSLIENKNISLHHPVHFNTILDLDSISAVKSSVAEGFGISFLPYSSVKKEIKEGHFRIISIEDLKITLPVNIISLKQSKASHIKKVVDRFLELGPGALC